LLLIVERASKARLIGDDKTGQTAHRDVFLDRKFVLADPGQAAVNVASGRTKTRARMKHTSANVCRCAGKAAQEMTLQGNQNTVSQVRRSQAGLDV